MVTVQVEYQNGMLGLDCQNPRISWKINASSDGNADKVFYQKFYQIKAGTEAGSADMWDSGKIEDDCSVGKKYQGKSLKPCTRYYFSVTIWDEAGNSEKGESFFETVFMNPSVDAWHGAKWIGAPEKYICTKTLGVFVLTSKFRIIEGNRAGLVFGANDERLMDKNKNQFQIAGENYICYEVDVSEIPARLRIYRVGYAPEDSKDIPFADVPIVPFDSQEKRGIINEDNCNDYHEIKIEVVGDCAFTYIDGIRVDAEIRQQFFGPMIEARQLNPLGFNDTTTFPRLCDFGVYAAKHTKADYEYIRINNIREPHAEIVCQYPGIVEANKEDRMIVRNESVHSLPMFRRVFTITEEEIKKGRLYITSRGIYDCRINGNRVTDTYLNPGVSQYDKHIMYQTYDITDLLQEGDNGIGVTLASGWWCDAQTFVQTNYNYFGDRESFLACLEIEYESGKKEYVVSDTDSWDYYGEGPYTYAGLFQGEHLDGRRYEEFLQFSKADFHIIGMKQPEEITPSKIKGSWNGFGSPWPDVDHTQTKIVGNTNAPVYEVARVQAVSMMEHRRGVYLYDLGQEIAGIPELKVKGARGTTLIIRYGEMLYPDLPEYENLKGLLLTENYRDAESIDRYIFAGNPEGETYKPLFTCHGFRYIELSGIDKAPSLEEVVGIQLSSVKKITGEIHTSNQLVNRFIENVKWSQLCNFISIPTDCPQRNERMGWAGDTHVFCKTATYQSDVIGLYEKYLQCLADLQEENGKMPDIAPIGGGFGGITYQCAMIFMVWEMYQQTGDLNIVADNYSVMEKWLDYTLQKYQKERSFDGPLGDWLAIEETDNNLLWNVFLFRSLELFCKMSAALGKEKETKNYAETAADVKKYWNETFIDEESGKTRNTDGSICDSQASYVIPISYNIISDVNIDNAYKHLARRVEELGFTVGTGFFGTGYLNNALCEGGFENYAYKLMKQSDYPSWLYPVTQGATTIWERWNSFTKENGFGGNNSMNSFNHYSLGSVLSWFYECVLGIQRDENKPGYKHFFIRPFICEESFDFAEGGFETSYGRIECGWKKTEKGYTFSCSVPANTSADLCLFDGEKIVVKKSLLSGKHYFDINSNSINLTSKGNTV